jgi:hypothetical protein
MNLRLLVHAFHAPIVFGNTGPQESLGGCDTQDIYCLRVGRTPMALSLGLLAGPEGGAFLTRRHYLSSRCSNATIVPLAGANG